MISETPVTNNVIYQARPVIEVDGQRNEMVQQLLLEMEMREAEGGLSALEMRFINAATTEREGVDYAFEYTDLDLLSLGKSVKVKAGDESDPQEIFRGTISGLEFVVSEASPPELVVLAEDALQKGRLKRRTKLYEGMSVADLVRNVASGMGLTPVIDGLSDTLDPVLQLNESDLAFLRRVLTRFDADLQVVEQELHAAPRKDVRRGTVTLELHSQLRSVRVMADLADQTTAVTFSGWDVAQGQAFTVTSSTTSLGPGQGQQKRTGSQILQSAFGERKEHLGNLATKSETEARALVDASFAQRARRFMRVEGETEGNPAIRVGTQVTLNGLGPRFENTYYVTAVRHRFDLQSGYRSVFEAEGAYFGG